MNELMKDGKSLRLHRWHFSNTKQARGTNDSREGDVTKHRVRHVRPLQSAPKVAPSTIERSRSSVSTLMYFFSKQSSLHFFVHLKMSQIFRISIFVESNSKIEERRSRISSRGSKEGRGGDSKIA